MSQDMETTLPERHKSEHSKERSELNAAGKATILDAFHNAFKIGDDQGQQQFIDVGCGSGYFTFMYEAKKMLLEGNFFKERKYLLPRVLPCRRLVAADCSDKMLNIATEKFPHPKIEYLPLDIVGDVEGFVRTQGQFHRVYSFFMLQSVSDQRLAMQNFQKLIAPGGEVFMVTLATSHFHELNTAMMEHPQWGKYSQVIETFMPPISGTRDIEDLRKYARRLVKFTDLIPLACEIFPDPSAKPTKEDMIRHFISCNAVYPLLNDEEKQELRKFVAEFTEKLWVESRTEGSALEQKVAVIHAQKPVD